MKKIKTIGLIAPSGAIRNIEAVNKIISILKKNYKVKKFYNEYTNNNHLSDTDENRIKYLESAFSDDEVDIVICVRGGFGAIRLIDKINYESIKDKYFLASSDGSILLAALYKKTNIKCYHGLMIINGFVENLKKNIEIIENDIFDINIKPLKSGNCKGILWGGNLSSIVSMFSGENYIPEKDIILFLEDLNEPLYKIDKMLYEIYRNEKLKQKIKGIIFGDFYMNQNEILPLLNEYSDLFKVPTYITDDITHKINNKTIPFGKYIEI